MKKNEAIDFLRERLATQQWESRQSRISTLSGPLKQTAFALISEPLGEDSQPRSGQNSEELQRAGETLHSRSPAERTPFFTALCPQLGELLELWWTPADPALRRIHTDSPLAASAELRKSELFRITESLSYLLTEVLVFPDEDVLFYACWAEWLPEAAFLWGISPESYFRMHYANPLALLLAAAMGQRDSQGNEVLRLLQKILWTVDRRPEPAG